MHTLRKFQADPSLTANVETVKGKQSVLSSYSVSLHKNAVQLPSITELGPVPRPVSKDVLKAISGTQHFSIGNRQGNFTPQSIQIQYM